jgi:hypothetical protein
VIRLPEGFDSLPSTASSRGERFVGGLHVHRGLDAGPDRGRLLHHGQIDGRHITFTGDNLFGDASDPQQNGHEAVVARNSAIFEEGYIYGAEYLQKLQPDLIVAGHSWVMDRPQPMVDRFAAWAHAIRDAYVSLSAEEDYRYMFDPYWVRAEPYRVFIKAGQTVNVTLHVRNFLSRPRKHRIEVHAPRGVNVEPSLWESSVGPESSGRFPLKINVTSETKPGVYVVALDVTVDGKRYGEWFDTIACVTP